MATDEPQDDELLPDLVIDGMRIEHSKFAQLANEIEQEWEEFGKPLWDKLNEFHNSEKPEE